MRLDLFQRAVLYALSMLLRQYKDQRQAQALSKILCNAADAGELVGSLRDRVNSEVSHAGV